MQPAPPTAEGTLAVPGSLAQLKLGTPAFNANPFPIFAQLRASAPVYRTTLRNGKTPWLVTRYDDAVAVLKDERLVKDRRKVMTAEQQAREPWYPAFAKPLITNMLEQDGSDHARLRALVHKAFTPRLVAQMAERVQYLCDHLLDKVEARGRMDLIRDYALPLPVTIIGQMLGVPPQDQNKFQRWSRAMFAITSRLDIIKAVPAIWFFMRYVRALIQQRRAAPQDDLLTALVQAEAEGSQLTEDELVAMVILLLSAGHETTVNLIGNGMLALLEHPDELARLRGDRTLIKPAIEELVRFGSPVMISTERFAREPVTVAGTLIPKGERLLVVLASANRDEQYFPDPDRLDVGREPNRHLAYGQGVHYCVGAPLARMEGQIAVQTLLDRFPALRLAQPTETLRWNKSTILRGLQALPVTF